jgi:N-acetylneuraminic acid mutarotase
MVRAFFSLSLLLPIGVLHCIHVTHSLAENNDPILPLLRSTLNELPGVSYGSALVEYNNTLILFGGWTDYYSNESIIWTFSLNDSIWHVNFRTLFRSTAGSPAIVVRERVYMFGGAYQSLNGSGIFHNDLYEYNPSTRLGVYLNVTGPIPPPRHMHGMAATNASL